MSNFNEQRRLADRAGQVLGADEADTLMNMLTGIDRVELQLTKLRAELDQKFAAIDQRFAQIDQRFAEIDQRFAEFSQRFVDVDRQMLSLETKITNEVRAEFKSMKRFTLTTAISLVAVVAAIVFGIPALVG
jgi:chromosome segregation ATPase